MNGEEEVINALVKEIRDSGSCWHLHQGQRLSARRPQALPRSTEAAERRPGFYMIESESKMLPMISRALASVGGGPGDSGEEETSPYQ